MINPIKNERGFALVLSLVVLVAVTLMGVAALMTSTLDMKIASNEKTSIQAMYAAEAGIAEAIGLLNLGTNDPLYIGQNPKPEWANNDPGAFTAWRSEFDRQMTGSDGATFYDYDVTVEYKRMDADPDRIAFYNRDSGYDKASSQGGGSPVYLITSTGRMGNINSRVQLELTSMTYDYQVKGGFSASGNVQTSGTVNMSGYSHNENGQRCDSNPAPNPPCSCGFDNLTGTKPSIYADGNWTNNGTGTREPPPVSNGTYEVYTPWDALGISEEDFESVFTNKQDINYGGALKGELLIEGTGNFTRNNLSGDGILVVHNRKFNPDPANPCPDCGGSCTGDCAPAVFDTQGGSSGAFKGIIIADQVNMAGGATVYGAVISLTTLQTTQVGTGNPTINFSCDAIEAYAGGKPKKKLSWNRPMN